MALSIPIFLEDIMDRKQISARLIGSCPLCELQIPLAADIEESEVLTCKDCFSQLVVASKAGAHVLLEVAPSIEEDWGE